MACKIYLQQIRDILNAEIILADHKDTTDLFFSGVKLDSRQIEDKNLFIALSGANTDGHAYVKTLPKGSFALVERAQPQVMATQILVKNVKQAFIDLAKFTRNNFFGQIIGVTGNSGKTSVKEMLKNILAQNFRVDATKGNFNNELGLPMSLMNFADNTEWGILELGANHLGEIRQLCTIAQPQIAIITNVTGAHLGEFGSFDNIAKAKAEILENLSYNDLAILPYDDKYYDFWRKFNTKCKHLSFGKNPDADISYTELKQQSLGANFKVKVKSDILQRDQISPELFLPALGEHQVLNALSAIAVALFLGMDWQSIKSGLANFATSAGRMRPLVGINSSVIIDDTYNANAGSVRAGIDYLASQTDKTKILVLGDIKELGDFGTSIHRQLGNYAKSQNIDYLFTYGDLASLAGEEFGANAKRFFDKNKLVESLHPLLNQNTIVLCKASHSMHLEDILKDITLSL